MIRKLRLFSFLTVMFCMWANAQDTPTAAFAGLISVNVSLKGRVSSRDAKAGQIVTTTLETPATIGGTVLPRGTMLIGHVVDVIKHSKETPDGLVSILFDEAKPKKGEPINIRASIFKIMLSEANLHAMNTDTASGMRGAGGTDINTAVTRSNIDQNNHAGKGMQSGADAPVQVMSTIPGVALSAVASDDKSGIMTAKNQDVDLPASMDMVIGVSLKQ
ncbi:MAG TPA: hypothetical protein VHW70_12155 [Edaphobacter sp.]|jgi:hypothetical protein|nr:hypothetical protein [Edaphobacter sp.]